MGRTRSPEVAKRNEVIYSEWLRGSSLTLLGERYSLSRQVIGRLARDLCAQRLVEGIARIGPLGDWMRGVRRDIGSDRRVTDGIPPIDERALFRFVEVIQTRAHPGELRSDVLWHGQAVWRRGSHHARARQ